VKLKTLRSSLFIAAMLVMFALPPVVAPHMVRTAVQAAFDLSGGVRKVAGYPRCGDLVYFMLPSGPNIGLPRAATIVRAYGPEMRRADGSLAFAVDLDVAVRTEDGVPREQTAIPQSEVGSRQPGTWDWQEPQESGFGPNASAGAKRE
jgi:hypothetical protein